MIKKLLLLVSVLVMGVVAVTNVSAQTATTTPETPEIVAPLEPITIKSTDIPNVGLKMGIRHQGVRKIQEALKALGFLPQDFVISDYFDSGTKDALKNFQSANRLKASGFLGKKTRSRLKSAIEKEKTFRAGTVDLACMRTAVEKRENSLISGYTIYTDKIKTARETRKTDLLNAWTIEDSQARHQAVNEAWKKFRESVISAKKEWFKKRRLAWVQFWKDRVNCGAPATGENESLDVSIEAGEAQE